MKETQIQHENVTKTTVTLYLYIAVNFFPFFCCKTGRCCCRFIFPQSSTFRSQAFKTIFTEFRKFRIISFLTRPLKKFRTLESPLSLEPMYICRLGSLEQRGSAELSRAAPALGGRLGCVRASHFPSSTSTTFIFSR